MDLPELLHPQYRLAPASPLTTRAAHRCSNGPIKLRKRLGEMARESHMIEAMVRGYHVYKEVWCAAVLEKSYFA